MSPGKHYSYFSLLFLAFKSSRMTIAIVERFLSHVVCLWQRPDNTVSGICIFLQLYFCIFVRDGGFTLI